MKGAFSLYDITGIFGDMLSYIRLFGLGTAGGILGLVVNSVAMNMSGIPYVGWFFTGLMLLVGHTAVLLLNSLGAFVHPMRLTFVEFYKNAGFGGGGRAFRPLTKNEN
jgi:V/A-type H+-transporting ATPase subunit I